MLTTSIFCTIGLDVGLSRYCYLKAVLDQPFYAKNICESVPSIFGLHGMHRSPYTRRKKSTNPLQGGKFYFSSFIVIRPYRSKPLRKLIYLKVLMFFIISFSFLLYSLIHVFYLIFCVMAEETASIRHLLALLDKTKTGLSSMLISTFTLIS